MDNTKITNKSRIQVQESPISIFLFSDTRFSIVWLILRLYIGYQWMVAALDKLNQSTWIGKEAGVALKGFIQGAIKNSGGIHPNVSQWYAWFLMHIVLPHVITFSYLVTYGELFVGITLILGLFTGIAAFFGSFMNMNYLFAGAVSINPIMFLIELFIILAWRTAGWIGLDRILLPILGTPWKKQIQ